MTAESSITIKARRFDPRDEETIDLKHFDQVEIRAGNRRIVVKVREDRLVVSADDQITIEPRGANAIWIPL